MFYSVIAFLAVSMGVFALVGLIGLLFWAFPLIDWLKRRREARRIVVDPVRRLRR